jgi:hypothetical protein
MLDMRKAIISAAVICVAGSIILIAGHFGLFAKAPFGTSAHVWRETSWNFGRDGWPNGRAFECEESDCGAKLTVYARLKKGFCNCDTGVADDDEIDRVGDVDLLSRDFVALSAGEFRTIANTPGRIRQYRIGDQKAAGAFVLSLASGKNCDAFVAMAVAREPVTLRSQEAVTRFLNAPEVLKWVDGLR